MTEIHQECATADPASYWGVGLATGVLVTPLVMATLALFSIILR